MQIIGRSPILPERGKIKIGKKGPKKTSKGGKEFSPPVKLNHFLITTMERDADDNYIPDAALMQSIAVNTEQDVENLTRIPVRLLYNEPSLNFATRYAVYDGRKIWCKGNGVTAKRRQQDGSMKDQACICERIDNEYDGPPPKCKINGILGVVIEGAAVLGGVWKFRTTSFNSVDGLTGAIEMIRQIAGGQIANIPLELVLTPKQATRPDGQPTTIHVVGLEYRGNTDALQAAGHKIAIEHHQANPNFDQMEAVARDAMENDSPDVIFPGEDPDDVLGEFHGVDDHNEEPPIMVGPDAETPAEPAAEPPKPRKPRQTKAQKAAAETEASGELDGGSALDDSGHTGDGPEQNDPNVDADLF